jgi:hypothetical protein
MHPAPSSLSIAPVPHCKFNHSQDYITELLANDSSVNPMSIIGRLSTLDRTMQVGSGRQPLSCQRVTAVLLMC